jgi:hypothetical protein
MEMEFARNVLGMSNAQPREYDSDALDPLICRLEFSFVPERYYFSFGFNPRYGDPLKTGPMRVVRSILLDIFLSFLYIQSIPRQVVMTK